MDTWKSRVEEVVPIIRVYKIPIILGSVSAVCIVISIYFLFQSTVSQSEIIIQKGESTRSAEVKKLIVVDIGGGVNSPGVYHIPEGSRIWDAITTAGGLSEQANTELVEKTINRAARVLDGSKLYIPTSKTTSHNNDSKNDDGGDITSYNSNTGVKGDSIVSINEASQAELEGLPGIGPVTAQKIIQNRPYMNLDELHQKKVVGKKLYEQIQSRVSL